jgi:hypothetical protein
VEVQTKAMTKLGVEHALAAEKQRAVLDKNEN